MAEWRWVENPAYVDRIPEPLTVDCHDGSPFLTVRCFCGFDNHVHESSIIEVPPTAGIATRCHGCRDILRFAPGEFHAAFAELRRRGWIDDDDDNDDD